MTKEQAINVAVEWWANKLKAKTSHSNGDNGMASILACILADSMMNNITDEQLDIFKTELRSRIEADMYNRYREVYLGCDYHPTTILRESAEKASIDEMNFPFKTDLYIKWTDDNYSVYIYDGYGAPRQELTV